ncbi:hypothetical protein DLAC_04864 [Tieghemostelium lacteum]|uniref:Transmembrane protein n=1 Tax=Tieghemostelium lacteum TaxID=361077 RepID=A0A151ZJJ0_TIELA|nr:hypothetical protein DLAC_04864 [Tieghemostelium lacteum]|eukprot:KYQ93974.1 hypothetical protein DLAC_04864 [Tieghemostelium lacteum]
MRSILFDDENKHQKSFFTIYSFVILVVLQIVAASIDAQGLFYFYQYSLTTDFRIAFLWFNAVAVTVLGVYVTTSNLTDRLNFIKAGVIFLVLSFLSVVAQIVILIISRNDAIYKLQFCNMTISDSTCNGLWGQAFCGQYLQQQCKRIDHGFYLMFSAQILLLVSVILFIFFSIVKIKSFSKTLYQPLLQASTSPSMVN